MINSTILYENGYFFKGHLTLVVDGLKEIFKLIRPYFIPLVESFMISDVVLNSTIGNKYGDIYEH